MISLIIFLQHVYMQDLCLGFPVIDQLKVMYKSSEKGKAMHRYQNLLNNKRFKKEDGNLYASLFTHNQNKNPSVQ